MGVRKGRTIIEAKKIGGAVLYGTLTIFLIAVLASFVFSMMLRFTELTENSISLFITIVSFLALFIGGFMSGGKGKMKGWMLGGATGSIYTIIVLLFQYLGHDSLFSVEQMVYHGCYIVTAMMGGILGVNLSGGPSRD
ncbi:TIGR04086 family membrane protein [Rossellomorea aquimaris]|uniref:TIGR04086 family membrane protein n=1 Tax=Rossellomorea aquimaris TaxID=189382 RepID=UPI001CD6D13E|nr:TIGR04086 family membrane protein [Rossellomorea aquimaris]MCA1056284.1 TIGR04086 family membrane protein [Rossellomorea aquimaris]